MTRICTKGSQEITDSVTHCLCGQRFGVVESRVQILHGVQTMWRRKKCPDCGTRKTTLELDEPLALDVISEE